MSTETPSWSTREQRESPWASGLTVFAAALMVVGGIWSVFAGIAALVHDEVYVSLRAYTYSFDLTAWGWIHLLLGILVAVAGFAVLQGQVWARAVGIALVCLSMVANFMFIPYYPVWSLLIIALDAAVIWALITYRREAM